MREAGSVVLSEMDLKPAEVRRATMLFTAWKGVGDAVTKLQNLGIS